MPSAVSDYAGFACSGSPPLFMLRTFNAACRFRYLHYVPPATAPDDSPRGVCTRAGLPCTVPVVALTTVAAQRCNVLPLDGRLGLVGWIGRFATPRLIRIG